MGMAKYVEEQPPYDDIDVRPRDAVGRLSIDGMTDREIAAETLANQRAMLDMVQGFMSGMESNPMMKMMLKKASK